MDLNDCERLLWQVLGYTESDWNAGSTPTVAGKMFSEMTDSEQSAVLALGFTQATWDATNSVSSSMQTTVIVVVRSLPLAPLPVPADSRFAAVAVACCCRRCAGRVTM